MTITRKFESRKLTNREFFPIPHGKFPFRERRVSPRRTKSQSLTWARRLLDVARMVARLTPAWMIVAVLIVAAVASWDVQNEAAFAAGLVVAFGGLALRNQRKELGLARELAIADVERKLDDRLVRADKHATLGALAIGVAHEIATPLGVIVGRSEQLMPHLDDARLKRNVQVVLDQCDRIDRVIRGMLALARGNSPVLERIESRSIARTATELVAHRFVTAGVTLGMEVADDLPRIACEPRLLEQAIANILLNACDACERGSGHVELRVEGDAARVAFIVTDNGKGIAQESAARILEPFFTTKPADETTGLGLSIANEIVRHNRGTLTIAPHRSSAGGERRGTRACIEIPAIPRGT